MTWAIVIGAVIAAALVYGYRVHTRDSRHLAGLFAVLAIGKRQGEGMHESSNFRRNGGIK